MRKLEAAFRKLSEVMRKTEFDAIRDTLRKEGVDSITNNEDTETMPPTLSRMLFVKNDNQNKHYPLQELEDNIIEDLFLSHAIAIRGKDVNTSLGTIPGVIYQDLLIIAQENNLFKIGYHPDGVWYALMEDRLIWSRPEIRTGTAVISNTTDFKTDFPKPSNKFNRYTALTKKEDNEKSDS